MYFTRDTVKLFCEHVKSLASAVSQKKKPKTIPDLYIHQLVKMLDLFTILDALKNMKACLNNDFSFYKRYVKKKNCAARCITFCWPTRI
mgnify:CR=1 FL=1